MDEMLATGKNDGSGSCQLRDVISSTKPPAGYDSRTMTESSLVNPPFASPRPINAPPPAAAGNADAVAPAKRKVSDKNAPNKGKQHNTNPGFRARAPVPTSKPHHSSYQHRLRAPPRLRAPVPPRLRAPPNPRPCSNQQPQLCAPAGNADAVAPTKRKVSDKNAPNKGNWHNTNPGFRAPVPMPKPHHSSHQHRLRAPPNPGPCSNQQPQLCAHPEPKDSSNLQPPKGPVEGHTSGGPNIPSPEPPINRCVDWKRFLKPWHVSNPRLRGYVPPNPPTTPLPYRNPGAPSSSSRLPWTIVPLYMGTMSFPFCHYHKLADEQEFIVPIRLQPWPIPDQQQFPVPNQQQSSPVPNQQRSSPVLNQQRSSPVPNPPTSNAETPHQQQACSRNAISEYFASLFPEQEK